MRKDEFSDIFGEIDEKYVEEARSKKPLWIKWGTIAACFCFIVGAVFAYKSGIFQKPSGSGMQAAMGYGFYINGDSRCSYSVFDYKEREQYGILRDSDIKPEDVGEQMGVVTDCSDRSLVGCKVYHFAKYPEKDAICIVETAEGYTPCSCEWIALESKVGESSDKVLSVYELPESLESMELLTYDEEGITGEKYIRESIIDVSEPIMEILSGKTHVDYRIFERRFAKLWYETYGNDDVYYSEKEGGCVLRLDSVDETNRKEKENELWDKLRELWNKDEKLIEVTTKKGFKLLITYNPMLHFFECRAVLFTKSSTAQFELSDADVEAMNKLLKIGE